MMYTELIISVAGTLLGIISLAYAIVQGIRIHDIRRRVQADAWLGIRTVRSIIGKLEESDLRRTDTIVAQVYGKSTELYRHLLKEAILAESRFSETTINRWRAAGSWRRRGR